MPDILEKIRSVQITLVKVDNVSDSKEAIVFKKKVFKLYVLPIITYGLVRLAVYTRLLKEAWKVLC